MLLAIPLVGAAVVLISVTRASATSPPIEHIVVILQENHSFDNVLGQLCIQDHRECDAASSGKNASGATIPLRRANDVVPPVAHGQSSQRHAIDNGKMDGWESVIGCETDACYTQYDPSQIPSLAALARSGAISDAFFSRDIVPSWGAHLDFFAQTLDGFVGDNPLRLRGTSHKKGRGWGCDSNLDAVWIDPVSHAEVEEPSCIPDKNGFGPYRPSPVPYAPTIADRLEEAGRSWGIYGGVKRDGGTGGGPWSICPTFAECLYGPQKHNTHRASRLLSDARKGTLPNFAIVVPTSSSETNGPTSQHNNTSMLVGDNYIGKEVSAIENGPNGSSTTIFIFYDDCGCFYDHAPPPSGLGIRLPLVIVSPYAKVGYTDHNLATNSSILAYAESVLHVNPVDAWDAGAYNFNESFSAVPHPSRFAFHAAPVPRSSLYRYEPLEAT